MIRTSTLVVAVVSALVASGLTMATVGTMKPETVDVMAYRVIGVNCGGQQTMHLAVEEDQLPGPHCDQVLPVDLKTEYTITPVR